MKSLDNKRLDKRCLQVCQTSDSETLQHPRDSQVVMKRPINIDRSVLSSRGDHTQDH